MPPRATITQAQLDREMARYATAPEVAVFDAVPPGMKPRSFWQTRWRKSLSYTGHVLRELVARGEFISRTYRVPTGITRKPYPVPHYGPARPKRK